MTRAVALTIGSRVFVASFVDAGMMRKWKYHRHKRRGAYGRLGNVEYACRMQSMYAVRREAGIVHGISLHYQAML